MRLLYGYDGAGSSMPATIGYALSGARAITYRYEQSAGSFPVLNVKTVQSVTSERVNVVHCTLHILRI